ncbi:hypothetical protein CEP51_003257 [Fusarium floridanum]|uniref:Uncharacterized protein n=1 Tax=Fusarium floridanum TaxID=1325733 RepID=A0A428S7W8_9HYPO|nr:hypothetical protein CEP51_003257 [Fusarium floridanum]
MPLWRKLFVWLYYIEESETKAVLLSTCVWFVLGVYWTIDDRAQFHKSWKEYVDIENENNAKGFGQLVPILLLGMPFLQGLQTYSEQSREEEWLRSELKATETFFRGWERAHLMEEEESWRDRDMRREGYTLQP